MDLFSCRNCIHNAHQGLNLGPGPGYCLIFASVLDHPQHTTCKHLHRKDLPDFLVEEALDEHRAEFADCSGIVELSSKTPVPPRSFDAGSAWDHGTLTPDLLALAFLAGPAVSEKDTLAAAFAGLSPGRRALIQACLLRRLIVRGNFPDVLWLFVSLVGEIDAELPLCPGDLLHTSGEAEDETYQAARWEVFFGRMAAIEELGRRLGRQSVEYPLQHFGSYVEQMDWDGMLGALTALKRSLQVEILTASDGRNAGKVLPFTKVAGGTSWSERSIAKQKIFPRPHVELR